MGRLDPKKLHVLFAPGASQEIFILPRRYTLTHSDTPGGLFLTIGPDYSSKRISRIYTHFMRDEILAEWKEDDGESFFPHCIATYLEVSSLVGHLGMNLSFAEKCPWSWKQLDTEISKCLSNIQKT